jgi:hypothetical protein
MNTNDMTLVLLTGIGATAATDIWAIVRRRLLGTPLPDFAMVGRWIGHLPRGRLRHGSIAAAPPVKAELAIGWITHYAIGVAFALLLPALWGREWLRNPSFAPALIVGVATVAAPLFVMQPAMGAGVAARRTPRPWAARAQSVVTHAVFGVGLYLAARISVSLLTGE